MELAMVMVAPVRVFLLKSSCGCVGGRGLARTVHEHSSWHSWPLAAGTGGGRRARPPLTVSLGNASQADAQLLRFIAGPAPSTGQPDPGQPACQRANYFTLYPWVIGMSQQQAEVTGVGMVWGIV